MIYAMYCFVAYKCMQVILLCVVTVTVICRVPYTLLYFSQVFREGCVMVFGTVLGLHLDSG